RPPRSRRAPPSARQQHRRAVQLRLRRGSARGRGTGRGRRDAAPHGRRDGNRAAPAVPARTPPGRMARTHPRPADREARRTRRARRRAAAGRGTAVSQLLAALYPAAMTVAITFLATVHWTHTGRNDREQP